MNTELFTQLSESSRMYIPIYPDRGGKKDLRIKTGLRPLLSPTISSGLEQYRESKQISMPL